MSKRYVDCPVYKFLQSRGLTVIQFLKVTELEVSAVYPVLEGVYPSISPRVIKELVNLGANEATMQRKYRDWRKERREAILKTLTPLRSK